MPVGSVLEWQLGCKGKFLDIFFVFKRNPCVKVLCRVVLEPICAYEAVVDSDCHTFEYLGYSFKLRNWNIIILFVCFLCLFKAILPHTLPLLVSCPVGSLPEMILSFTAAMPDLISMYNLISFEWQLSDSLDHYSAIINWQMLSYFNLK